LETDYRTLLTIPDHLWGHYAGLAGYTGTPTPARRRHLAAWAWHTIALMPLKEWPGWQEYDNPRSGRDMYRVFTRELREPNVDINPMAKLDIEPGTSIVGVNRSWS
jgi:hypothetical protein